jgi:D-alanyl-D-alanine carboxypeptidase (penicillin-binding protein 5/6)
LSLRKLRHLVACVAVAGVLAGGVPSAALAASASPSGLSAPAAALGTMDGTELWARDADSKRAVASTIKLLNALVVLDHASLDDTVVVSRKAVSAVDEGGVGLVAGQRLTVRQLMTMMLVVSANDAAEVLAVHVAGSEPKFVEMMNAKAASLGLKNTRAIDPHGLSKRERSSAGDLTVIARELMTYPEMREIVAKKKVVVPRLKGSSSVYSSTDKLLGHYAGIEGIKTGFTNPAGYCLVGAAKRGDTELVGVVLGGASSAGRFADMRKLLDWGFAHFRTRRIVSDQAPIGVVAVGRSGDATVGVRAAESYSILETIGPDPATVRVVLPQSIPTSVWRGQQLGTAEVYRAGSVIATIALLAEAAVSDPAAIRAAPVPKPPAAKPAGTAWQRVVRTGTHAMGLLSLQLLGTPVDAR